MRVVVIGAGHSGLAMASHLALNDNEVVLWNRTFTNILKICEKNIINCRGIINGTANICSVTDKMEQAVKDQKLILVTTPASAHRDIAKTISPYTTQDMIIVLNPGRTFGALDFYHTLKNAGCKELPVIAETQTIIYTCRRFDESTVIILELKKNVYLSVLNKLNCRSVINRMPECIKDYFTESDSMAVTSLGNVGMVLHCAPVLMNIGWIENKDTKFLYYYDGITITIAKFLEELDSERLAIGQKLNLKLESVAGWMKRSYGVEGNNLFECIRNNNAYRKIDAPSSIKHRYIEEDVPCGLVPIENLGRLIGVKTPCISIIIDLACKIFGIDFRAYGRTIGIDELQLLTGGSL